jgi:hypothetical protein
MLSRKPAERGTPTKIINHSEWFHGFDWDGLISKTYQPRYVPRTKPVNKSKFS